MASEQTLAKGICLAGRPREKEIKEFRATLSLLGWASLRAPPFEADPELESNYSEMC